MSRRSVLVEWCAPLLIDQNGPVTNYLLSYAENIFNIPVKTLKLIADTSEYLVEDLEEDDQHTFNLSAVNSIGEGPTVTDTIQTPPDGKVIKFYYISLCRYS